MGVDIMSCKALENAVPKPKDICYNWWTWRPIVNLISILNELHELGISQDGITAMHYNNGHGIEDPEVCKKLAKQLREIVSFMKLKKYSTLYFNKGSISSVDYKNNIRLKDDQRDRFNKQYPGIFYDPVWFEGDYYSSMYSCNIDDLEAFASFLDRCYGFQVH